MLEKKITILLLSRQGFFQLKSSIQWSGESRKKHLLGFELSTTCLRREHSITAPHRKINMSTNYF